MFTTIVTKEDVMRINIVALAVLSALTALAGLSAVTLVAPQAEAAARYAMTCIENKTTITLAYSTKWGENASWRSHRVVPAERISHTWEYAAGHERESPDLYVSFDDDLSSRMKSRTYVLKSFAAPQKTDCKRYGKEYQFRYDGSARQFIDLVGIR